MMALSVIVAPARLPDVCSMETCPFHQTNVLYLHREALPLFLPLDHSGIQGRRIRSSVDILEVAY